MLPPQAEAGSAPGDRGAPGPVTPWGLQALGMGRGEEQGADRVPGPPGLPEHPTPRGRIRSWILTWKTSFFQKRERGPAGAAGHISLTPDPWLWHLLSQLCRDPAENPLGH